MSRLIIPQFTDLDLFALAYAVVLVAAWHVRDIMHPVGESDVLFTQGLGPYLLGTLVVVFFGLATHHVLSERKKSAVEAQFLLILALAVMIFSAVMLYVHALDTSGLKYVSILQMLYVAWLVILITHLGDNGDHLHSRMLVEETQPRVSIVLVAYASFALSLVCMFEFKYAWPVVLAFLTLFSVPVASGVGALGHLVRGRQNMPMHGAALAAWLCIPVLLAVYLGSV